MSENGTGRANAAHFPPEGWLHAALLSGAVAVIGLSWAMRLEGWTMVYLPGASVALPESCTARLFLGINCPSCGLTRAFISISHGEFAKAWRFNPASFAVYALVIVQWPWQSFQIWRLLRGQPSVEAAWVYALPIATGILLIAQWLVRLIW